MPASASDPATFATNVLVIVTPPDNPAGIETLDDLDGATWVRCADEAPCGKVAPRCSRTTASTPSRPAWRRTSGPRSTRSISGEADAGLVYASDAVAAGERRQPPSRSPARTKQLTSYFIAPLEQSTDADLGEGLGRPGDRRRGTGRARGRGIHPAMTDHDRARAPTRRGAAGPDDPGRRGAVALLVVPLVAMVAATESGGRCRRHSGPRRSSRRCGCRCSPRRPRMLVCLVLGLPLAWLLARVDFRGRRLLRALVTVPMVLPPVVAGIALRSAFGRSGLLGEPLLDSPASPSPTRPGAWCWRTSSSRCRSW